MGILSVTQLNRYMSFKIKEDEKLRGMMIKGEISNFSHHVSTGNFYFTLKDETAAVKAVMFANFSKNLKFEPEDGLEVIALASVGMYEKEGVYQLYVTDIQPCGEGVQNLARRRLMERLEAMGVFAPERKRGLPAFPENIGVITSKTGAVLQDIITVLTRRYPLCTLNVYPSPVQGGGAAAEISGALARACSDGNDVLILARGGGSAEDLSAFNTEEVALAVFNSGVPVISAVGHETDYTAADFAADRRAPTPSAAAELVSADALQISGHLDYCEEKLRENFTALLGAKYNRVLALEVGLKSPANLAEIYSEKINALTGRLCAAALRKCGDCERLLGENALRLEALNPLRVLSRGYSIAYKDGAPVTNSEQLTPGETLTLKFSIGEARAKIISATWK